ncbi:hypothetical protein Taro_044217 [Colocasia esculenta]|uniref:Uncharacterized protein n=1 Tax=Colocasia esculenta TaxID=4460 RepID=A0A843WN53_COLES|nr:hypothetical protein [Colocasia esculenta]
MEVEVVVPGGETMFSLGCLDDTWLFLPNLEEVRDVGAYVVRLGSHVVALRFHELLCLGGCVPRVASTLCCSGPTLVAGRGVTLVASACVDSAGSAGVMFGLTRVVVKSSLLLLLLEFLLLWLVRDW